MFKNYLKIALKSLVKHRLQTIINILGMTTGLSSCLLIGLFVADELSYDDFFPGAERIYRVSRDTFVGSSFESREATNAPQVAALLAENINGIEAATRVNNMPVLIRTDEAAYYEDNFLYADNNFFELFSLDWQQGSPGNALADPFSIVLTESIANKYFGQEDAIGQTLTLDNNYSLRVTGVIADLPANTHLSGEAFISLDTLASTAATENALDQWGNNNFHTYIRLAPGIDIESVENRFPDFVERFMGGPAGSQGLEMSALNIRDIHLRSTKDYELKPGGSMATVLSFSVIALCIVLIAGINFMNLSTARYTQRAREVGLRKTLGAARGQLVQQFLSESMLLIMLSALLALMVTEFLLPAFSAFTGKTLSLSMLYSPGMITALTAFVIGIGLFTGSYPAFFLSSFKPASVLKGNFSRRFSGGTFRNALVVLQFAIAIVLLVATSVVYFQMQYANNMAGSFDRERIVVLTGPESRGLGTQWETLKQRLLANPGIEAVTASDQVPLNTVDRTGPIVIEGNTEDSRVIPRMHVDYDFFRTYGIDVTAGRTFQVQRNDGLRRVGGIDGNDTRNYMINETAAREFGWTPETAVGRQIAYLFVPGSVVGVVSDSFFESAKDAVKPMVYFLPPENDPLTLASIRITGINLTDTLAFIDATWNEFMPDYPVQRRFLAQDFNALYQGEQQQGELFRYFALLAVFIACFGLLGLATFVAERRTKEIGVRKVMGGSVWSIVVLLTNDFSKLVLLSNLIAWPIAYYAMNRWLENFAYRIDLTPMIFIGSGLIALCIAWVTVGGTAAKAASRKPVLALRYE